METEIVILCIVTSLISSVLMAFFLRWIGERGVNHRVTLCETQIDSLIQAVRGQMGNAKIAEKRERESLAMAEAATMLQDPTADKAKIIQTLLAKYPDVAASLAKKYMGL